MLNMHYLVLFFAAAHLTFATSPTESPTKDYENVYEILNANVNLSMFAQYIDKAGLRDTLINSKSELTVIAPTDKAFSELSEKIKASLSSDAEYLKLFIRYHILKGIITKKQFVNDKLYDTLQPIKVRFNYYDTPEEGVSFTINGVNLTYDEMRSNKNGIVDVVDYAIPIPTGTVFSTLKQFEDYPVTTFYDRLMETGLYKELNRDGPFTVFAPVNSAFEDPTVKPELTKEYYSNYIISGTFYSAGISPPQTFTAMSGNNISITMQEDKYFANDAEFLAPDYPAFNGVIFIINKLLWT